MSTFNRFCHRKGIDPYSGVGDAFAAFCDKRYSSHVYLLAWEELSRFWKSFIRSGGLD